MYGVSTIYFLKKSKETLNLTIEGFIKNQNNNMLSQLLYFQRTFVWVPFWRSLGCSITDLIASLLYLTEMSGSNKQI